MNHSDPNECLTCTLLKYIRDSNPTESQLATWLGGNADVGRYHVLRKAGLVVLNNGRVDLSRQYLSTDGSMFKYGTCVYKIDEDVVMYVCCHPPLPGDVGTLKHNSD